MEEGTDKQDMNGSVWRDNFSKLLLIKYRLDLGVEFKTSRINQWVGQRFASSSLDMDGYRSYRCLV